MTSTHPLNCSIHSRLRLSRLLEMFPQTKPDSIVLEIGCGTGFLLGSLVGRATGVGFDMEYKSLASIGEGKSALQMVCGDIRALPFRDSSVDVLICSEVLEHMPEGGDFMVLKEACRVLKPSGRLYVTVPASEGLRADAKLRNLGHDVPGSGEYHYRNGYSLDELKSLFSKVDGLSFARNSFSMFLVSELLMNLQKWYFYKKSGFKEHSDVLKANSSLAFKLYKALFPILFLFLRLEDLIFCPLFKGHIHVAELERMGAHAKR